MLTPYDRIVCDWSRGILWAACGRDFHAKACSSAHPSFRSPSCSPQRSISGGKQPTIDRKNLQTYITPKRAARSLSETDLSVSRPPPNRDVCLCSARMPCGDRHSALNRLSGRRQRLCERRLRDSAAKCSRITLGLRVERRLITDCSTAFVFRTAVAPLSNRPDPALT